MYGLVRTLALALAQALADRLASERVMKWRPERKPLHEAHRTQTGRDTLRLTRTLALHKSANLVLGIVNGDQQPQPHPSGRQGQFFGPAP